MQLNSSEVSTLLTNCIDLPDMTPREKMLLREMAHQWGMGKQSEWGAGNGHLMAEVAQIFDKCRRLVHVP